jgi:hypothetical protein
LANMVASYGSISVTCINNEQACAQFSSTNRLCGKYCCLIICTRRTKTTDTSL